MIFKDEIYRLEEERCQALMAADYAKLAALMSPDLTYVHSNGHCDTKDEMLARMEANFEFLEVKRGPLTIHDYGTGALVMGTMHQRLKRKETGDIKMFDSMCTQVWANNDGVAQMVMLQASVTAITPVTGE